MNDNTYAKEVDAAEKLLREMLVKCPPENECRKGGMDNRRMVEDVYRNVTINGSPYPMAGNLALISYIFICSGTFKIDVPCDICPEISDAVNRWNDQYLCHYRIDGDKISFKPKALPGHDTYPVFSDVSDAATEDVLHVVRKGEEPIGGSCCDTGGRVLNLVFADRDRASEYVSGMLDRMRWTPSMMNTALMTAKGDVGKIVAGRRKASATMIAAMAAIEALVSAGWIITVNGKTVGSEPDNAKKGDYDPDFDAGDIKEEEKDYDFDPR